MMNDKASSSESTKTLLKLFLSRFFASKLLMFRCESERKTFHDSPKNNLKKEGYFRKLVFCTLQFCMLERKKHAQLAQKRGRCQ